MIEKVFKDIAGKFLIMPISAVSFYSEASWGAPFDANLVIHNLEAESSFRLTPITRNTDRGTVRRLGYKFEASLYVPYNDFSNEFMVDYYFEGLFSDVYLIQLVLGTGKAWSETFYQAPESINANSGIKLSLSTFNLNHTIEIESVEFRPRTIIRLFGFIKSLSELVFL